MKTIHLKKQILYITILLFVTLSNAQQPLKYNKVKTEYINYDNGSIAYKSIGKGRPIILCNRFRGTLDTWDPLFLETLANNFKVVVFDYPEIGYSSGKFPKDIISLAKIVKEITHSLKLDNAIIGGWSFGGYIAQTAALEYPDVFTHLIIIGSNPPGENELSFEPIFLERALKPSNNEEDEVILFFEPILNEASGANSV
ncbi:MAG TPA: alpha/beta hydrolase [Flavobacteriaceae bacterium]|jgi:pimeloyl-ACP methyl ester carboxylesterase